MRRSGAVRGSGFTEIDDDRILAHVKTRLESGDQWPDPLISLNPNFEPGERLVPAAQLRYHGDFDWAGVAITNRLVARVAVKPWLMTASDYETGLQAGGPALLDTPVEPSWDAELGAAMRLLGVAVHEESVPAALLVQLGSLTD